MSHFLFFVAVAAAMDNARGDVTAFHKSLPRDGSQFFRIGESVNLTCTIDNPGLSVLFKREGKNMAENGVSYQKDDYPARKRQQGAGPIEYQLEIRAVRWRDRGKWECVQGEKGLAETVDITVPGTVRPLQSSILERASADNTLQGAPSTDLSRLLYGKGVRNNPFDLTRGERVRLKCESGCSYPKGTHHWTFRNLTVSSRDITPTETTSSTCNITSSADGFLTLTTVVIDCAELHMVGSNEVQCKMSGTNESRSVHVLCPGGHRPWELTNGEIVGLSIAVGLAALMLVLFVMSAKKIVNSYRYGSVMGGIRV